MYYSPSHRGDKFPTLLFHPTFSTTPNFCEQQKASSSLTFALQVARTIFKRSLNSRKFSITITLIFIFSPQVQALKFFSAQYDRTCICKNWKSFFLAAHNDKFCLKIQRSVNHVGYLSFYSFLLTHFFAPVTILYHLRRIKWLSQVCSLDETGFSFFRNLRLTNCSGVLITAYNSNILLRAHFKYANRISPLVAASADGSSLLQEGREPLVSNGISK